MITALATVGGVVGVVWQLGSTAQALRSSAYQEIVAHSLTLIENLISHKEVLKTFATESGRSADEPELDRLRWHFMVLATIRHFENLHVQNRLGSVTNDQWHGYQNLLRHYLKESGFGKWWSVPLHQSWFSQSFREMVATLQRS